MDPRTRALIQAGLDSADYRGFLNQTFAALSKGKKFNYAAFSRKAGFNSRGFLKEVLDGRKRLTGRSFPKVIKALVLPATLRQYFAYLVMLEEPELNLDRLPEDVIRKRLHDLQEKMRAHLYQETDGEATAGIVFRNHHVLEVYSVLGRRESGGATLADICRKTGHSDEICLPVLRHLLAKNVITEDHGRYFSLNPHLIFDDLGANEAFKSVYLESLGLLKRKASTQFNCQNQLFFQSYFSVDRHRMPELKKRLRDLILEFVESNESEGGDGVAKLVVGLF